MASICDRCDSKIPSNQIKRLFDMELCLACFTDIEKYAHTKTNQSTTRKVLAGFAKVGKGFANSAAESVAKKDDPNGQKFLE